MDTSPTKATESEFSQDVDKKSDVVHPVRVLKRAVESQEPDCHNGRGNSPKVPKLSLDNLQRTDLSTGYVRSLREADWNKVKSLADIFDTSTEPLDKQNHLYLLSSIYSHVRDHCSSLESIYWTKPNFAYITYFRKWPSSKKLIRESKRIKDNEDTTK
jgi:hypothetical protein